MMTAKTYIARTYPFKILGVSLMSISSLLFLVVKYSSWFKSLVAILGLGLAYIFWKVPSPKIEVDETGIRLLRHGKPDSFLISRIVIPDTECKWDWIDSVTTRRDNCGSFHTTLYLSENLSGKPIYRVTIESSLFKEYVSILKIVKERASQAHFDELSESILNGQLDIRSMTPLYLLLFLIVVVSAFLYIFLTKKG